MRMSPTKLLCLLTSWLLLTGLGQSFVEGAEDAAGNEFFEKKIRPLLVQHCYECHATDSKKIGGRLLLDHREGGRQGGDSGAAIVPGSPEKSLLIKAILFGDVALQMPPSGKLPAAAIADLTTWISQGAPDPREAIPTAKPSLTWDEIFRKRSDWWSLKPVTKPALPNLTDETSFQQPVDRFIFQALAAKSLAPAASASPRTLARRLSLVLTGLAPSPEQMATFLQDHTATVQAGHPTGEPAVEKLVDSLLASPHFGERWARHWLDVVRFSETHGNEWNYEVHHAWRYRDYLIRAFNSDVRFDQLIREHIAGDMLPQARWNAAEQLNESVMGTGFYRFGEVNHDDCIGLPQIGYDLADNQLDTLTKAFQATTVACARCHDHKLDAISQQDYYGLLGVLRSARLVSHSVDSPEVNANLRVQLQKLKDQIRTELATVTLRQDVPQFRQYMAAAKAKKLGASNAAELAQGLDPTRLEKWGALLTLEKLPIESPLEPWRALATAEVPQFSAKWQELADKYAQETQQRATFNQTNFVTYADLRDKLPADWQIGGQGLAQNGDKAISSAGEFTLHPEGAEAIKAILPAGCFTHALSEKLNGTLRTPVLPEGKKRISFQVLGERSSAVRLVSNNCQLNYTNYRALTSSKPQWVTFTLPEGQTRLRTYGELMTMLDNPKFPDQLSALGGDAANYRLPWDKAVENPRSYFGITRVVLHDTAEPPQAELAALTRIFAPGEPASLEQLAARYETLFTTAVQAWEANRATDDDIAWINSLLEHKLLSNEVAATENLATLIRQYRQVEGQLAQPRVIAGMAEGGAGIEQPLFMRGDCLRPGEAVPRRYLEVLAKSRAPFASPGSGRLELAERIASAENPLTARVLVNRVWQHLFGAGLVRTVDDFGHLGELPSHPELLDYLASEFVEQGWSIKKLIRTLVLTKTFQLASEPSAEAREKDPENRLLQHYPARRLEAEGIRDAILAASGRLDRSLFGPSIQPFREKEYADRRLFPGPVDGQGRRSIYIKNNLMESPKFLSAFNLPGGKVAQGRRDQTNVPAQALALLNDPFVLQQAEHWGKQLINRPPETVESRIEAMFQQALSRPPTANEQQRFGAVVAQLGELHGVPPAEVLTSQSMWQDVAHSLFNLQEFIYIP